VPTDGQTHTQTDTQTQTNFIICPMLYAIAMGQIITFCIKLMWWSGTVVMQWSGSMKITYIGPGYYRDGQPCPG